jgi:hypothetical protein
MVKGKDLACPLLDKHDKSWLKVKVAERVLLDSKKIKQG